MIEPTMNQYAAPTAEVADVSQSGKTGELNVFTHRGRIGRLRYLAYSMAAGLVFNIAFSVLATVIAFVAPILMPFATIACWGAFVWFSAITGIKRCHDIGISGWWTLTMIIPIISLIWIFWPGNMGDNQYGPPPPPNTTGVKILACIFPIFMIVIVGILAAVAIPQYQMYLQKAKAPQAAQQVNPR